MEIGQGLVGQVLLERETVLMTAVPPGYTTITSGLGDATPSCIILVPMKYNEQMRAQEEELRQNLEELEATQEDMRRKSVR